MGNNSGCSAVVIMYYFEDIINEIEAQIGGEIDIAKLAKMANMSVYEFRRIFSFVTKISFGEYVRKRRLSLAAPELFSGGIAITDAAAKYGYDSPSSFSRAFKEFHGISPSEVVAGNGNFRMLTKISAEIVTGGGRDIEYSVSKKDGFSVGGYCGVSEMTDSECCEAVWSGFYESGFDGKILGETIFAVYENKENLVKCIIGEENGDFADKAEIPESLWAQFKMQTTEDVVVNEFYRRILGEWLESSGYKRDYSIPNVEVFPKNMEEDGFLWEIWIPITEK